jgi:hypothetical protein
MVGHRSGELWQWGKGKQPNWQKPIYKCWWYDSSRNGTFMGNKKLLDATDFYDKGKKENKRDVIDKFNKAKNK